MIVSGAIIADWRDDAPTGRGCFIPAVSKVAAVGGNTRMFNIAFAFLENAFVYRL
ncbi:MULTISPECIES: hypothetical protein [unclassified Erwinia]|uniref:hypothetical protein n=1 Tax=unclassified Erwinia TaxID=2622719 RepID=UPI0013043540|nr:MULTISPECIES: hypothetical protein [unclassified Erwinia]